MNSANKITSLKNAARIWVFGKCHPFQRSAAILTDAPFSDGGGPGVISQLLIANEIMHQIQWILKLDEVPRPCDYAEMMVGSELGAYVVKSLHRYHILTTGLLSVL
jgi:hypothetical protein